MDDDFYTVSFPDGTVLSNLRMNNNNFVSDKPIDRATFNEDNMLGVSIRKGFNPPSSPEVYRFVSLMEFEGKWYFIIDQPSPEELKLAKIQTDMEYLAMMMGIDF